MNLEALEEAVKHIKSVHERAKVRLVQTELDGSVGTPGTGDVDIDYLVRDAVLAYLRAATPVCDPDLVDNPRVTSRFRDGEWSYELEWSCCDNRVFVQRETYFRLFVETIREAHRLVVSVQDRRTEPVAP